MIDPTNEISTREYFAVHAERLGLKILESRSKFPDYLLEDHRLLRHNGQITAEAEFKSSNYILHEHDLDGCDLVICWERDATLPIETLELKTKKTFWPGEPVCGWGEAKHTVLDPTDQDTAKAFLDRLLPELPHEAFIDYWLTENALQLMLAEHQTGQSESAQKIADALATHELSLFRFTVRCWLTVFGDRFGPGDYHKLVGRMLHTM